MAHLDLSNLGLTVTSATRSPDGITLTIDDSEAGAALARLNAAASELRAAWEAMPSGIREAIGPLALSLAVSPGAT